MSRQPTNSQAPRKNAGTRAKPAPKAASALAKRATQTGRVVSKAGAAMAKPVMRSLQQEEPQTLAKMAIAALAPKLIQGALKFAVRNPMIAVAGILVVSSIAWLANEQEAS